ncbi:4-hydroxy-3-methylbut-2-enyl diphosphate reductase [Desulfotomaculum arcticum]|uniref:4-hydroxy-3-methylbut-2-enyl diphosphate reductase n=1 Tax=Desulfotruncus arcticus DSM 17038 TaxID=1121424 RepID=A0A1I2N0A4_9FIRM|nr:bifunctional 4-hydroxy-3-methylbut-2-enyl diphosphate reductase/30S ribosomal protein S1 [Desulfotruncus arcticus]SFF94801.1 4-hydroxy-3-methylbut-2-enyl diphosphate reductase [Desulfotomaculum arcticum] [Desulfotruncus arcticus DSM 17038]
MDLRIASTAGFCFGVKRAVEIARKTRHNRDGPVYTLGPLIHNDRVTGELAREGITIVNELSEIKVPGTVIIRSHGVAPEIITEAERKGLVVVDATCPFVRKVQQTARELAEKNIPVIIVGDPEHPEVKGIVGWTGKQGVVVRDAGQAAKLDKYDEVGVVAQTTQRQDNLEAVVNVLKGTGCRVQVFNTICLATSERQKEALELSKSVDLMLVIGGRNSANTAKLTQICNSAQVPVYQVESAGEVKFAWLKDIEKIGITAGASTPGWIIEEVCCRMMDFEEMKSNEETVTEEQVEENSAGAEQQEEQHNMEDAMEVKNLRHGEIVKGVVVQVNQDEVLVDVGAKSEGVIPIRELSCYNVESPTDVVNVGDEIDVYVLKSEDNEGKVVLSKEKADAEKAWSNLEAQMEQGDVIKGVVREVVKGGLLVDLGVRAFLPASLVEMGYVEDLSKYLNTEIDARIIELNRPRRKVILSRKAVLEEEYARKREELLENLTEDQVVKGVVRRLTNFGAFVDIGGVDGLLHISEMAWYRINHPSEVVQVGDELEVMVLRVDRESEKISLGLKQVLPNPWDNVEQNYPEGAIVNAKVVRLAPFGAFVQLEPGVEGLVHISHLADRHVETPDEVVHEGEEIKVKVLSVDKDEKRIRLSIREVDREKSKSKPREQAPKKQQESPAPVVSDGGTVTIGEMVGDIFDEKK